MAQRNQVFISLLIVGFLVGRAREASAQFFPTFFRLIGPQIELAGRDLNGVDLNSNILEGRSIEEVSLKEVRMEGKLLKDVWLAATKFYGEEQKNKNWQKLQWKKFVGAVFQATLNDGNTVPLRIESMERHPDHEHNDVIRYEVSYLTATGRVPLCGTNEDGLPILAIPLVGRWDYRQGVSGGGDWIDQENTFTFGCEGFVLAKCVLAGYKPWRKGVACEEKGQGCEVVFLGDHHQACTRMLRADYCGDGTSYTQDNVDINVYDGYGIRTDSEDWDFEAEWNSQGAICAARERLVGNIPDCAEQLKDPSCGLPEHLVQGAMLISEVMPTP